MITRNPEELLKTLTQEGEGIMEMIGSFSYIASENKPVVGIGGKGCESLFISLLSYVQITDGIQFHRGFHESSSLNKVR